MNMSLRYFTFSTCLSAVACNNRFLDIKLYFYFFYRVQIRKLVAKYSAGLRIRSHPSLQSEQIGVVPPNEIVSFVDEVHNDDGVWLRISAETMKKFCQTSHAEAWCLQYSQHFNKTFLVPLEVGNLYFFLVLSSIIHLQVHSLYSVTALIRAGWGQ